MEETEGLRVPRVRKGNLVAWWGSKDFARRNESGFERVTK